MARYEVLIKPSAAKELEAVTGRGDRTRLVERIQALQDDPRPPGCVKLSRHDRYRIRQGAYRVLFTVDDRALSVTVVKVGHRRDVYRGDV